MRANFAAWTPSEKHQLEVSPAPYPIPSPHELIVHNRAVAINPIDWVMQTQGTRFAFSWVHYPFIFGHDVAGTVVEIGSGVTRFKVGDRVVGQAHGIDRGINKASHGGFQRYPVLLERNTCVVPEGMGFEEAVVMPLALATAANGLFEKNQLGLEYPSLDPKPTGKTVLVWGGSTSVGCNAIQLAVAAGYEVIATSSPRNFDMLKKYGAREVFDYNDAQVVEKIVSAMQDKVSAGAIAMGDDSTFRCIEVLGRCKGDKRIAMATYPVPQKPNPRWPTLHTVYVFATSMISIFARTKLKGIKTSMVWGSIAHSPVSDAVYVKYLPDALAQKKFHPAPEPLIVGEGLETIQSAMDLQKEGVSGKKIVVSLA